MNSSRRAQSAHATREKLVRAARQAFARDGFAGASMDRFTAAAGLTRGALYHHFGDKKGLFQAVIEQLDAEMSARLTAVREQAPDLRQGLLAQGQAYLEMALDPEIQRLLLREGPAVLGNPADWPGEAACLEVTRRTIERLIAGGAVEPIDAEAAARLLNGAALGAALWVAAAAQPAAALPRAIVAYRRLAEGLLLDRRP